jgi:hypothetical protein
MAEAKTKKPTEPKTFAVEEVDPNASTTLKEQLAGDVILDGTHPDKMPKARVTEAQKAALLAEREAEEEQAREAELSY